MASCLDETKHRRNVLRQHDVLTEPVTFQRDNLRRRFSRVRLLPVQQHLCWLRTPPNLNARPRPARGCRTARPDIGRWQPLRAHVSKFAGSQSERCHSQYFQAFDGSVVLELCAAVLIRRYGAYWLDSRARGHRPARSRRRSDPPHRKRGAVIATFIARAGAIAESW
jgi:hypothetical protein